MANKFVDESKIWAKAGDGGDGCVAFRREKYIPKGGPSGGDGGRGGDLIFVSDSGIHTLLDFKYRQHFFAEDGGAGSGKNMEGKAGEDLIIKVPRGTVIKEIQGDKEVLLADMKESGETFVAARGGKGGKGNTHFKSSTNQAPRQATRGEKNVEMQIKLELKLIADVGIVGYPNSGKSTLISRISAARPKIGDYPFTTLVPNLGVVKMSDMRSFVVADIPGLIEGASSGKGLGHKFLRHVERTKVLVHLIDVSEPGCIERYKSIRKEIDKYSGILGRKTEIIAGSKIDAAFSKEEIAELKKEFSGILFFSSFTGEGLKELTEEMWRNVNGK